MTVTCPDRVQKSVMQDWVQRFVQTLENQNTALAYTNDLTQFVDFLCNVQSAAVPGVDRLADAREVHFQEYLFFLRDRTYSRSTLARKISAVKAFYRFLEQQGAARQEAATTLASQRVEKTQPDFLTPDEIQDLLSAPLRHPSHRPLRDKAMLELIYYSGLRASVLLQLNIADVAADRSALRLPAISGKTIPLRGSVRDALDAYLHDIMTDTEEEPLPADTPLFQNHRHQRLTRQGLWTILKSYLPHTGIQRPVTLEMIRHSHNANLSSGVKPEEDQA